MGSGNLLFNQINEGRIQCLNHNPDLPDVISGVFEKCQSHHERSHGCTFNYETFDGKTHDDICAIVLLASGSQIVSAVTKSENFSTCRRYATTSYNGCWVCFGVPMNWSCRNTQLRVKEAAPEFDSWNTEHKDWKQLGGGKCKRLCSSTEAPPNPDPEALRKDVYNLKRFHSTVTLHARRTRSAFAIDCRFSKFSNDHVRPQAVISPK